ncbi:MAG: META domain-containing protein [Bacteroidales bacterium]
MKNLFYLLVSISLAAFTTACNGNQKKSETTEPVKAETAQQIEQNDAATLMGDWNIVTLEGTPIPQTEETPYLSFNIKEKRLAGMTGCNRVMGDIIISETDPSAISFDKMGSTKMMCHNDALETAVLAALAKVRSYASIPCQLVKEKANCIALYDENKKELMTLQQEPLVNTEFQQTPQEN